MRTGWLCTCAAAIGLHGCAADSSSAGEPLVAPMVAQAQLGDDGFRELLATDWELPPGTEHFVCTRRTLTQSLYFDSVRPLTPAGTHHVLLTAGDRPNAPDGTRECDAADAFPRNFGGGGVGTREHAVPAGAAMQLLAGNQVMINLHQFNPSDVPLRGHSGVMVRQVEASSVRVLADSLVVGPTRLEVPPGRSTSGGRCTLDREATFFAIMPHMHQTGAAMKVVANSGARGEVVLYDGAYNFDDQQPLPIEPLTLQMGDVIEVLCTYQNPHERTLRWGQSSNDEMCQVGLGRIPAGGLGVCNR